MSRIAYLVPGTGFDEAERNRREGIANELTTGDVSVVQVDAAGPSSIESTVEESWCVVGELQKAHEIRDEYDVVVIGCFGDPGLRPLRELLDIPVVGSAEATVHTAAQISDRFAWLTILDELLPLSYEQAHAYGLDDGLVSVRSVDTPVESIDHGSNDLVERMITVGRQAIEEDGAEALFPGCMSLSFAQRHDEIQERLGAPFLDPATIALEQAAMWARHGIVQSSKTYPSPSFKKLGGLLGAAAVRSADN